MPDIKPRLGRVEKLIIGLLTIHAGISAREVADELCYSETYVSRIMVRLQDKGVLDANNQPLARTHPLTPAGAG